MSIILSEVTNSEEAMQRTRKLVTMYQTKLTCTERQLTVAVLLRLIHQHAAWAVHRLNSIIFTINLGKVHILFIMSPVTRLLPESTVQNHWSLNLLITITAMHFAPVVNQLIADNHAIWMEEWEAWALFMNAEEIKLLANLAMVALSSLLQHVEISLQLILLLKGSTIDTLQHLILLTATPVSTCYTLQLNSFYLASRYNVRTSTQVSKFTLSI